MTLIFALEGAFSKRSQVMCFSVHILGTGEKNLLKQFLQSFRMFLCNNRDQTCFSDT